jgi:uncharacterized membrane protein YcaP (DUF421 family)
MGKSQIGEMQPFEFVITLLIAELACIPMADSSIPLLYGIIAVIAIFVLHQIMWLLDIWFKPMKYIVCGKPSVVITKDGLDESELKKNNLDVSDVVESMRSLGYFSLDDVYYGIYEANGSFSALENPSRERTTLSYTLVDSGKLDRENLKKCGITMDEINSFLSSEGAKVKEILVMTVSLEGRVYFQKKGEKYKIKHIEVGDK